MVNICGHIFQWISKFLILLLSIKEHNLVSFKLIIDNLKNNNLRVKKIKKYILTWAGRFSAENDREKKKSLIALININSD